MYLILSLLNRRLRQQLYTRLNGGEITKKMKWIGWSIAVLGVWILLGGIIGGLNWVNIICGVVIAVLAIIGAIRA
jgi:D-alanyl-lipoteichoic acid acyltransferase DltB (MBOAT superfamily)